MQQTEITALAVVGILIILDYITGLVKAAIQHDISSTKMREGLYHKGAFVLIMVLAEILEHAQRVIDLGYTLPIVIPAAMYVILTETTSILENLGEINPELKDSKLLQLFRTQEKDKDQ